MTERTPEQPPKATLSPTAMTIRDVARLLSKVGGEPVTEEMLQADIAAGAPLNADGTMNVVHYAAWLVRQMAVANGSPNGD